MKIVNLLFTTLVLRWDRLPMEDIKHKPIEIFCGTGGVGRTTLATSRALYLASHGHKVLLITIDPSHRLKQILNMQEEESGVIVQIPLTRFPSMAKLKKDRRHKP